MDAIRDQIARLKEEKETTVAQLSAQITALEVALGALNEDQQKDEDELEPDEDDYGEAEDEDEGEIDSALELPYALIDAFDGVFRCSKPRCGWEIAEGICSQCRTEYICQQDTLGVPEAHFDSDWTENEAISLDRRLFPSRSGSPRTFEDVEELEAYGEEQLVQRGATAQMIERFQLSFTETRGIIAWADQDLFDEFSGPAMKEGDFWKIHLGRRVRLDEDDLDGALFMEGLLEDAMLFSQNGSLVDPTLVEWDTRHESPGVWVTKPRVVEYADVDWDRMYEDFESSVVPDGERIYELDMEEAPDPGNAVLVDEYESTDYGSDAEQSEKVNEELIEVEEDEMCVDGDSGWACQAGVPDAPWGEDDDDDEEDSDGAAGEVARNETMDGSETYSEDSFDSDFDSDDGIP